VTDPAVQPEPSPKRAGASSRAGKPKVATAVGGKPQELAATIAIPVQPASTRPVTGRRRFRRRLLLPLVGLLAIVGVVGGLVVTQLNASKPGGTIWQSITAGITNGTVPKQTALEAFAYVYKVSIPGVTVPQGRDGADVPTSGSGVMRWVRSNWDELTADQRAVVNRYLVPGPNDQKITFSPAPSAAASAGAAQPRFELAAAHITAPAAVRPPAGAPQDLVGYMINDLNADIARIGPKLGMAILGPGSTAYPNISLIVSDTDGGNALMETHAVAYGILHYQPCEVTVYKNAWQNEQVPSNGGVSPRLHVLLTHEVIHCYQNVIWDSVPTSVAMAPWITEGTAAYLAGDDTGIVEPLLPGAWQEGYFTPETALTNRTYDAVGYYAFLAHQGRKMWTLMKPAWEAAAKGPDRSNAFIAVLGGDAPEIRNNWAASYLRQADWGDPWQAYGFGLPDTAKVTRHDAKAVEAPGWMGTLLGRANTVLNVTASSGEVVTITTDGLASVHDNAGNSEVAFGTDRFCTVDGGCVCPQGTLEAGKDMASKRLTIPFVAAFNAPFGGSKYSITGEKLDDLCKRPPTPQPQQKNPCGASCTSSNGDPHMLTVNGFRYDFQAAGEFTLLRSADGSLEIQARQEPYGDTKRVASNTAVAARVGSHRVGVYSDGASLVARVDGVAADLASPQELGAGGRIARYTNGFVIDFPDGTRLWALSVGQWGVNVQIGPSSGLKTSGVGLLGPVVKGGLGVPALPDGTRLSVAPDKHSRFVSLYGSFANAWRVTDSTTLFDYDAGKSTATYAIKDFPAEASNVTSADLTAEQKASGESACASITNSGLHDECVFDVGVTGQAGFADGYQVTQTFYDAGIADAAPTPTGSEGPGPLPSGLVSGAMSVIDTNRLGGFALGPDNTVYLTVEVSSTKWSLLKVDPSAGRIMQQVDIPARTEVHVAGGAVWLPGLKTDSKGSNCSVTRFDAGTLAEQATIPIPCTVFDEADIVSDGSAAWFVDETKYDSGTNKGAVLTRIDPVTNAFGPNVDLPFINGNRLDSQGALFYFGGSADNGYYRLAVGSGTLESIGRLQPRAAPAGAGLWSTGSDGHSAEYFTASGAPSVTLTVPGTVVGGDADQAYVEILGQNAEGTAAADQLWSYPVDGSAPVLLAYSPTQDGDSLSYFGDPQGLSNANGFLKVWTIRANGKTTPTVFLQWVPK
jgi:hypothetical protein